MNQVSNRFEKGSTFFEGSKLCNTKTLLFMKNSKIIILFLSFAMAASCSLVSISAEIPYSICNWSENDRGNHRAIVKVKAKAGGKPDAVRVKIPWRRRDLAPKKNGVIVFDAATNKQILNVAPISITSQSGNIAFQPATVPGEYQVYFLPYREPTHWAGDPGTYFSFMACYGQGDPAWFKRNRLDNLKSGAWKSLPKAKTIRFEDRTEFDSVYPMEVVASRSETVAMLSAHRRTSYLLFPEDRKFQIRMKKKLPLRWIKNGPAKSFKGEAAPNEFYAFQIGVWAARKSLKNLRISFHDLVGKDGRSIPASAISSINMGGTNAYGKPFSKTVNVYKELVQPLWVLIRIPQDASGLYDGKLTISAKGQSPTDISVSINVTGDPLPDHGVSDLWRMSRIAWLDSSLGIDDEVIPPYTPLKIENNSSECLDRKVTFAPSGLPSSIVSRGREILAAPIELKVETDRNTLVFTPKNSKIIKRAPGAVERITKSDSSSISANTWMRMEFDGCILFRTTLTAKRNIKIKDIRLRLPFRKDVAKYMMGMSKRGGFRPKSWDWKWNIERPDNLLWLGDVDAGIQLMLQGDHDVFKDLKESGLPPSWYNSGKGGCKMRKLNSSVMVDAFSGNRRLKAGKSIEFRFRLLVTPFHKINRNHWNWRHAAGNAPNWNIGLLFHGTPFNPYINYPFIEMDALKKQIALQLRKASRTGMVSIYYTIREMSNHVAELWALRSLGDEIFSKRAEITAPDGITMGRTGGGYPWLREHLVDGYSPGWRQPLPLFNCNDAAIGTKNLSRWHNYYVEGLRWLMQETGIAALYLDGIGYDREIMKRVAKVMFRATSPDWYNINCHSGNSYDYNDMKISPALIYMEHMAYISDLWFGEMFDYGRSPDYWLVEMSGIPFGITGEMLNYQNGGNPYRGMIYGMTGRHNSSCSAMWNFWDSFGIQDAEWIGYWSPKCPVTTDSKDVLTSVYKKPGRTLVALAHWAKKLKRRKATAVFSNRPPSLGGVMDKTWKQGAKIDDFFVLDGEGSKAAQKTAVSVSWDNNNIYIAFKCTAPKGTKADITTRDGAVWLDDSIEIHLQPDTASTSFYHFIGNAKGVFYDEKSLNNSSWNGNWNYKTMIGNGFWEGTLSIPFSSLGMVAPRGNDDLTIGFNVGRSHFRPSSYLSCWSPIYGSSFNDPGHFGRLTFSRSKPSAIQKKQTSNNAPLKINLNIDWSALGLDPDKARMTAPAIANFQPARSFEVGKPIPVEWGKGWLIIIEDK